MFSLSLWMILCCYSITPIIYVPPLQTLLPLIKERLSLERTDFSSCLSREGCLFHYIKPFSKPRLKKLIDLRKVLKMTCSLYISVLTSKWTLLYSYDHCTQSKFLVVFLSSGPIGRISNNFPRTLNSRRLRKFNMTA